MSKARLVITAVVVEGRPVRGGVDGRWRPRSWIYELLDRDRSEGEAAFERRSRRPHSQPRAILAATVELIIRRRDELDAAGLGRWCPDHRLASARTASADGLTGDDLADPERAGLTIGEQKKKPKTAWHRLAAEQPNEMRQVDFTYYRLSRPDGHPAAMCSSAFPRRPFRYALSVTCYGRLPAQPRCGVSANRCRSGHSCHEAVRQRHGLHHRSAGGHTGRDTINGFQAETTQPRRGAKALQTERSHHLREGV